MVDAIVRFLGISQEIMTHRGDAPRKLAHLRAMLGNG